MEGDSRSSKFIEITEARIGLRLPPNLHQEAPRHEAVLGRKVRLVIWDTTSRGKRKRKNNQKIW